MKELQRYIYKTGYPLLRLYYFLLRPTTLGVRCIVLHEGKILLIRHTYGPTRWTLPGGGINKNESVAEAACREALEETGVKISSLIVRGSVIHTHEYKHDTVYIVTASAEDTQIFIDNVEVAEAKWFPLSNLPSDSSTFLQDYLSIATDLGTSGT